MLALVFDVETTGLIDNRTLRLDKQLNIIEIYACLADLRYGQVIEEYESLVKPPKPFPEVIPIDERKKKKKTITEITGLTNAMLDSSPAFGDIAPQLKRLLETAPCVISHNLSFDKEAVEIEFERLGQTITWPPGVCTVEASIHCKGYRMNLPELHEYLFGKPIIDRHRAKIDTKHLLDCCVEMHRRELL